MGSSERHSITATPHASHKAHLIHHTALQAPSIQDLCTIAEIASCLPLEFNKITLCSTHDLTHGLASAVKHDPGRYRTVREAKEDIRGIWLELVE